MSLNLSSIENILQLNDKSNQDKINNKKIFTFIYINFFFAFLCVVIFSFQKIKNLI